MSVVLTEAQEAAKKQFIEERGIWKWSPMWETILLIDHDIVAAFAHFSSVPHKLGTLEPKVRELCCIAIDASITHLHEPGLRNHIRHALELGATKEEILETLEIASAIGTHTLVEGYAALAPLLKARGEDPDALPLTEHQKEIKETHLKAGSGYWPEAFELSLKLDEPYFEAYSSFINVPRKESTLDAKTKELLWLAVDASPTTVYAPGIAQHMARAMELGATKEELISVLDIVAGLGVHSITVGVPILKQMLEELNIEQ